MRLEQHLQDIANLGSLLKHDLQRDWNQYRAVLKFGGPKRYSSRKGTFRSFTNVLYRTEHLENFTVDARGGDVVVPDVRPALVDDAAVPS